MRHKWNIPKVKKGVSAFCVKCGLIKEMSNVGVFYFRNDSAFDHAGSCPGVQTYNIEENKPQEHGTTMCQYGNRALNLTTIKP